MVIVIDYKASNVALQKKWLAIRPQLAVKDDVSRKLSLEISVKIKIHFVPRTAIGSSVVSWP